MDKIITPQQEAVEETTPQSKQEQVNAYETTERPPSVGEPHLIKMFEMGEAQNHFEMPSLIKEIDEFVLSEMERNKMQNTAKSYEEIIKHYLDKLNLPHGIDIYTKTEKVLELMKINKKILEAAKEKEELMEKPITELSSIQLRKRFGL